MPATLTPPFIPARLETADNQRMSDARPSVFTPYQDPSPPMTPSTLSPVKRGLIRLAVVDDHSIIRGVFATLVEDAADLTMAWTASSLTEARRQIQKESPDFLVMDVNLPDGSGFDFVKEVLRDRPDLPVLMISASEDRSYQKQALASGARGYIPKDSSVEKVVEAMTAIQNGGRWFRE